MFMFGEAIACLKDRWDSARALGLVQGGERHDLAPGEMMIDRTLLYMLDARSIDIGAAVARIASSARGVWVNNCSGVVGLKMNHGEVVAAHEGIGPPVIRTPIAIGRAEFDGVSLVIDDQLSGTIMSALAERPLGDIFRTGVPSLDRRLITAVEVTERKRHGQVFETVTRFELAPDLVKLGYAEQPGPNPQDRRESQ